ncbi:MAG TPA: hypothetical protein VGS16_08855 [Candidatus Dormibacteraeota bacterium]|nr:hypothetical protein [Candidatus Dormibacteraeota bacterium]
MSIYRWLVFVHVLSILILLLLHGATFTVTYALRKERGQERIRALLDLSLATFDSRRALGRIFWINFLAVVASGIALMVVGGWWRMWWPWLSAAVFLAIVLAMTELGRLPMAQLRRAVGLPWIAGRSRPDWKAPDAHSPDQFATEAALARLRPTALTAIGVGGFAVLLWLMMFRPF